MVRIYSVTSSARVSGPWEGLGRLADQEIYDLLREIELNELVLPEFQREFVWNREQARGLIDSLYREFPTGSLLLWKTTKPPALKNKEVRSDAGSVKVILPGELEKQYIPPNKKLWKTENYESFLRERRRLIADGINKFLDELSGPGPTEENFAELLKKPEDQHLEFKSTLRFSIKGQVMDASLEKACLKTICAFMNANGGLVIIGISDDRKPLGLVNDYQTLKRQDRDGFENHLTNLISSRVGNEFLNFIEISFENIDDKETCKIKVYPSNKAAILKEGIMQEFYVRTGNNSRLFSWPEAVEYIREHWK